MQEHDTSQHSARDSSISSLEVCLSLVSLFPTEHLLLLADLRCILLLQHVPVHHLQVRSCGALLSCTQRQQENVEQLCSRQNQSSADAVIDATRCMEHAALQV